MGHESGRGQHSLRHAISGKALLAVVAWGASFVATRVALEGLTPVGLVAVRFLAGTCFLVAMIKVGRRRPWPARRDLGMTILLGCVLAVHLLIQAHGLQHTSAINTGWIVAFIPVCLAVGAHLCLKQRVKSIGWWGVLIGAGGVFLVTVSSPPNFANARFGDVLQLCSCLTWTVYTLAAAGVVARNDSLSVTTSAMAIAAILVTVAALWTGFINGALTGRVVLAVAFLGLVCSGLPYYLWFQALDEHGAARIGSVLYFEPFVTMAFAATLLAEPITGNATAGGACVLIGVWLVARGTPRRSQHKGVDPITDTVPPE